MNRKTIEFRPTEEGFSAIFKTDHGRRVLLTIRPREGKYIIQSCRYIDRSEFTVPKKVVSHEVDEEKFLQFLQAELDTTAWDYIFSKAAARVADMVSEEFSKGKPKVLILLREGCRLKTIFKNRFRRVIQLTLKHDSDRFLVESCYYTDKRDAGAHRIPPSLVSIECGTSAEDILQFVNDEPEGGFTHIVIADVHNIDLKVPICDAI